MPAPGLRDWFGRMLGGASDLLYPAHCPGCDARVANGSRGLCRDCQGQLVAIAEPYCKVCGEPFDGVVGGGFRCGNCAYRRFHFDFAVAGYRSSGPARDLVHAFKYSRRVALRQELGQMLLRAFEDPRIDLCGSMLVPVPLYHRRRRERGFNQAEEVALVAARQLGLPVVRGLRRLRHTAAQVHMQRDERLHNMRGAFGISPSKKIRAALDGTTVFLIDDVLTTGATAQECARVLKKDGGAAKVVVVTACRAAGFSRSML